MKIFLLPFLQLCLFFFWEVLANFNQKFAIILTPYLAFTHISGSGAEKKSIYQRTPTMVSFITGHKLELLGILWQLLRAFTSSNLEFIARACELGVWSLGKVISSKKLGARTTTGQHGGDKPSSLGCWTPLQR